MKWVHKAILTAFAKPEDTIEEIKEGIIALVPFNLKEAKIQLQVQNTEGFDNRSINVFTIILIKESHTNDFLQFLLDELSEKQKTLLISQAESRLDAEYDYFIRIDKERWIKEREIRLTDSGDCFHIKLALAVFPKKKEKAIELIEKLFTQKNI